MDRTNRLFVIHLVVLTTLVVTTPVTSGNVTSRSKPTYPCHVSRDEAYHGTLLDCQNRDISSLPLPQHWIPDDVTTILLDSNNIGSLDNDSFSTLTTQSSLRYLSLRSNRIETMQARIFHGMKALEGLDLSRNKINEIEPFAFTGLNSLRRLDLSYNKIDLSLDSLNGNTFHGLKRLSALELKENDNGKLQGSYSNFLFNDLENLMDLSLDTFSGDLNFGSLFSTTKHLSRLYLSGGLTHIKNNSFESFASTRLNELIIERADSLYHTETGAFSYLKYLEEFRLIGGEQGIQVTFESLAPFINRHMTTLYFEEIECKEHSYDSFVRDSVLSRHMARHLNQICVENFTLKKSDVFIIEEGVFADEWRKCLKYFALSDNPLRGDYVELFATLTSHRLEYFEMMGAKYASSNLSAVVWRPPTCLQEQKSPPAAVGDKRFNSAFGHKRKQIEEVPFHVHTAQSHHLKTPLILNAKHAPISTDSRMRRTDIFTLNGSRDEKTNNLFVVNQYYHDKRVKKNTLMIFLPKSIRIIKYNSQRFERWSLSMHSHLQIINGESLEEVHIADNGIFNFTPFVYGVTNLNTLDISNNNGSIMSVAFLDVFSSLVHLNMGHMHLDVNFIGDYSKKLFQRLTRLNTLVLSENDLSTLATGTFSTNTNLSFLDLSGNRFISVPFDLRYLPRLCCLDLRRNSIRTLSSNDINNLEAHASIVKPFHLFLDGNAFYCGCNNLRFLSWLRITKIKLDKNRNYSCILDSGVRTHTRELHNLEAVQRACLGQTAFWLSLVLVCLMILSFMACITILRFKTQLQAFILRSFWNPFFMTSPADYPTGVYIGYADHDTQLACLALRLFVEEELGLSTYVRHRDLLPASDMAESIMASINCSWRVLLVVSQHYLDDPWSFFALKVATYAVQCQNPGRLVLALTDRGQHQSLLAKLPDCVLRAVREESIITMTPGGRISYENKEALKTALLYQG